MSASFRSPVQARLGRFVDIVLAGAGLLTFSPAILLIAVAIVAESGFPVFFSQIRIGRGGVPFRMWKFRKLDARRDDGCPLTLKDDPRLTRVGRFLAETKLDELPQLYNIIRGDMAIVGPRPESLAFADCFVAGALPLLNERPGIFGPSQVAFRNECAFYPVGGDVVAFYRETLFPSKVALDLAYYPGRTVWSDTRWIVRGLLAVAGGTGAGGTGAGAGSPAFMTDGLGDAGTERNA